MNFRRIVSRFKQAVDQVAMEFDTPEAMKKYLEEHPGADKANHSVKKHKEESEPKGENGGADDGAPDDSGPEKAKSDAGFVDGQYAAKGLHKPLNVHDIESVQRNPRHYRDFIRDFKENNSAEAVKTNLKKLEKLQLDVGPNSADGDAVQTMMDVLIETLR